MGIETAIIAASAIAAGASLGASAMAKGPKSSDLKMPKQPQQPNVTAADRASKKAMAATGRSDTVLTSPLGVPGQGEGKQKSLLGM